MMVFSTESSNQKTDDVFHVTLADPKLYVNGVYTEKFLLTKDNIPLDLFQMEVVLKLYQ